MINRDTIFAVILITLSAFSYLNVNELSKDSKFFPQVISVILITLSLAYLITSLFDKTLDKVFGDIKYKKLLPMAAGIIGYIAIMNYVGFLISSIFFMSFFIWFLNDEKKNNTLRSLLLSIVVSLVVVFGFYYLFHSVFLIPLPERVLF